MEAVSKTVTVNKPFRGRWKYFSEMHDLARYHVQEMGCIAAAVEDNELSKRVDDIVASIDEIKDYLASRGKYLP